MADILHSLTIGDVARENRRRFPGRLAAVRRPRLTYPELDDRATRLVDALSSAGVGSGDQVLWLGQNCHRVLELLVACSKIGAVLGPVNWRQQSQELAFAVEGRGSPLRRRASAPRSATRSRQRGPRSANGAGGVASTTTTDPTATRRSWPAGQSTIRRHPSAAKRRR